MIKPDAMEDDSELLDRFAQERSEEAFALLARRHAGLVFDIALRVTRSRPLAEEIVQNVFVRLAQKARRVASGRVVAAWLHRAAVLESRAMLRAESRRRKHTGEAAAMAMEPDPPPDLRMSELLQSLDEALDSLPLREREALLRHYYQKRSYEETGALLGTSEAAARQLAARARKRLAAWFGRRGKDLPVSALSVLLAAHFPAASSSQAALAGVAARAASSPSVSPPLAGVAEAFRFVFAMKLYALICAAAGFCMAFLPELGAGEERASNPGAPEGPRLKLGTSAGRFKPGVERARLTEGFDLSRFEKEMAEVASLSKDRRLGFSISVTNAMGTLPAFDLSHGRQLQLARLVMYQPTSEMPALFDACRRGDPESKGQLVLGTLFARWAEADPAAARAAVDEVPKDAQIPAMKGICATLLNRDVGAAARMAFSLPIKINQSAMDGSRMATIQELVQTCGLHDPRATLQACLDAHEILAGEAVDRVVGNWMQGDPEGAVDWLTATLATRGIPGRGRTERRSIKSLLPSRPELAARIVDSLPAGPLRDSLTEELNPPAAGAADPK